MADKAVEPKKQVTIYLPIPDFLVVRKEASCRRKSISNLLLELIEPGLKKIRKE